MSLDRILKLPGVPRFKRLNENLAAVVPVARQAFNKTCCTTRSWRERESQVLMPKKVLLGCLMLLALSPLLRAGPLPRCGKGGSCNRLASCRLPERQSPRKGFNPTVG